MRPQDLLDRLAAGYEYDPMYGALCNERDQLKDENAKLRELCKTLYQLADESYVPFGSVNQWMDDFAKTICAMRELGIEVE